MYSICVRRQLPWFAFEGVVGFAGLPNPAPWVLGMVELLLVGLDVWATREVADDGVAPEKLEMGTRIGSMNGELLGPEEA